MNTPHVYADGFGRWHAIVEDTPNALRVAINSMAGALLDRGSVDLTRSELVEYLNRNIITSEHTTERGKLHFVEYRRED